MKDFDVVFAVSKGGHLVESTIIIFCIAQRERPVCWNVYAATTAVGLPVNPSKFEIEIPLTDVTRFLRIETLECIPSFHFASTVEVRIAPCPPSKHYCRLLPPSSDSAEEVSDSPSHTRWCTRMYAVYTLVGTTVLLVPSLSPRKICL